MPGEVPLLSAEAMEFYSKRPVEFVEDYIMVNYPEMKLSNHQIDLLNACIGDMMISVRSGHGTGKSFIVAIIVIWFLSCFPFALVPCTAPTQHQLRNVIWRYISSVLEKCPILKARLEWQSDKILNLVAPERSYAVARTSNKSVNLSGFHDYNMLFICDEAAGVPDPVYEVIQGACTEKNNRIIAIGNPVLISGWFYDSHHKAKKYWKTLHFNAEESPFVNKINLEMQANKWGKNSDVYKARVQGIFPSGNPLSFLQLSDIMKAVNRDIEPGDYLEFGIDTARFGDDLFVIACRQGNVLFPLVTKEKCDSIQGALFVERTISDFRKQTRIKSKAKVKIDSGGSTGVNDLLRARSQRMNIEVIDVNFGGAGDEESANATAAMWVEFRDLLPYISFYGGENGQGDDNLIAELSTREWRMDDKGRVRIQPKGSTARDPGWSFKKQYGQSPDRSDAVVLCFSQGQEKNKIFPGFSISDTGKFNNFEINWNTFNLSENILYFSMYQKASLDILVLACVWDKLRYTLKVFAEFNFKQPRPEQIISGIAYKFNELSHNGLVLNNFKWVCNDEMIGKSGKSWEPGTVDAFREKNIHPVSNPNFNLGNAVASTQKLFSRNKLIINSESCRETGIQCSEWHVDKSKKYEKNQKPMDYDNGFCLSLINLVSMIVDKSMMPKEEPRVMKPYSYEKMNARKTLSEIINGTRSGLNNQNQIGGNQLGTGRDGWMV